MSLSFTMHIGCQLMNLFIRNSLCFHDRNFIYPYKLTYQDGMFDHYGEH